MIAIAISFSSTYLQQMSRILKDKNKSNVGKYISLSRVSVVYFPFALSPETCQTHKN